MPPSNSGFHEGGSDRRISALRVIFILIFLLYAARLFAMQILFRDVYIGEVIKNSRRTMVIPAQRGEIFDRNSEEPLVLNDVSFVVSITPAEIPREKIAGVFDHTARILGISSAGIEGKIPPQYYQLYQPVEIALNVPLKTIAALAERKDELPGVSWISKPIRNYGAAGSLSHILGYVGNITRDELTILYNKGYQQGDVIGKAGIERQYDELLRGRDGYETRFVDVKERDISSRENTVREPPKMGKNLVLTVDRKIQTLVEKALGKRMGSAVVMRPATGEILAMVSYPWYDPNIFISADLSARYTALENDPNKPLLNRAIQAGYPPASAFKVVMTTGILAEKAFPPEQTISCPGEISYGGRQWRCHIRKPGHGRLNLRRAMAESCDIYYWIAGRDYLHADRIVSYARAYGFGENTGVDLPGEIAGLIPTPQWKEQRRHERWLDGDTMNMSIGQGFSLVTPMQMANMVCMAVNNGLVYKPHILKEVRDPVSGAVELTVQPEILRKSEIDPNVFETVRRDMRGVISEGTAREVLNIKSVQIAGKTGTGEVGLQDRWHSWFAAYAPYTTDRPEERVVAAVVVEAANEWEWWAPKASAIIFQGIFAGQTYEEALQSLGMAQNSVERGRME